MFNKIGFTIGLAEEKIVFGVSLVKKWFHALSFNTECPLRILEIT